MRLNRNFGLSLRLTTGITCLLEILFSGIVGSLCVVSWIREGKPVTFLYEPDLKDTYIIRNKSLEGCVVVWCLAIVMTLCIWRIVSAVILFFSVKRDSVGMAQYWMMFKIVAIMISAFVVIASFTVSVTKITSLIAFMADVITSYFIYILYPDLERMERAIKVQAKGRGSISG